MRHKIKKGDKYLCIKDYFNYEDDICFEKDSYYESLKNDTLHSEIDQYHGMKDEPDFFEHFRQVKGSIDIVLVTNTKETALRYNQGKPEWSLVHFKSLEPMVKVLEFGAKKYDRNNWQKEMSLDKILDSAQRHLASMIDGETNDPESNELHAGHVLCNMMFYIYHYNKNKCCGDCK